MPTTDLTDLPRDCFHCGKRIKGECVVHVPPLFAIQLCGDFVKAYHPACYAEVEKQAREELDGNKEPVS